MSHAPRTRDPNLEASSSDDERGNGARIEREGGRDDSSDAAAKRDDNDDDVDFELDLDNKKNNNKGGSELDREWESRRARFYNVRDNGAFLG